MLRCKLTRYGNEGGVYNDLQAQRLWSLRCCGPVWEVTVDGMRGFLMVLGALDSIRRYGAPTGKSKCAKMVPRKAPRSSWGLPKEPKEAQEGSR